MAEQNDDGTPAVFEAKIEEPSLIPPVAGDDAWFESIEMPEGVELSDKTKEYDSLGEYIKGMQNQSQLISAKGIIPPAEGADEEAQAAFLEQVKPYLGDDYNPIEIPESYEIEALEGLEDDRRSSVTEGFKKIGLNNDMANGVMALLGEQSAADQAELAANIKATNDATKAELQTEWGDDFPDRIKGIERITNKVDGLQELLQGAGIAGTKPVMELLDMVARGSAEDSLDVPTPETMGMAKQELTQFMSDPQTKNIFKHGSRGQPAYDQALKKRNALALRAAGRK